MSRRARLDVEEIRRRIDLAALISEHVTLRPSGRGFLALCPFHQEKTPSFHVDPERGWYCHGCGAGGDALTFLMRVSGANFPKAARALARRAEIPLSRVARRVGPSRSSSLADARRWSNVENAASRALRRDLVAQRTALLRELFDLEDERYVVEAARRHDPEMQHDMTRALVRQGQPFITRLEHVEAELTELDALERTSLPGLSPTARALQEAIR